MIAPKATEPMLMPEHIHSPELQLSPNPSPKHQELELVLDPLSEPENNLPMEPEEPEEEVLSF